MDNATPYTLCHIVAAAENDVIGSGNDLPWKLPKDFKYFKNKTWGMPVIMGRNTYESMKESLPGRINIVITRNEKWQAEDVMIAHNIDKAIDLAGSSGGKEIFIIGGGEIFKQTLDRIARIYLTRVHAVVEGDTYYPPIDETSWNLSGATSFPADEKHKYGYTFEIWERDTNANYLM
jgi:dihydrofolate reductase